MTKNFRGSPHIDQNDFSVQYALSVGDFDEGGELCVEDGHQLEEIGKFRMKDEGYGILWILMV